MYDIIELAGGVPALHPERKGQLNRSPLKNWVEKNGGLPTYINSVATALLRKNPEWAISRIIATAVKWAKEVCATGRAFGGKVKVSKAVQAAACAAVAQWERKKAQATNDMIDDEIINASDDQLALSVLNAQIRKQYRAQGIEMNEVITMSDDEYFAYAVDDEDKIEMSLDMYGEGDDLEDTTQFMEVLELSAESQKAIRLPLNTTTADKVGNKRYKKEILRVGELVVDRLGRKFNFTPNFLKGLRDNFQKQVFDYVPLLYTKEGEVHASSADPGHYGGTVENLTLDDEENPTRLYGEFNLTDATAAVVDHNPKFGVSVTAHPNYVDTPRGQYYGPMLLDVAATHKPKMTKMDGWEKVAVQMSDDRIEYEVLDLSMETFVEILPEHEEEKVMEDNTIQLSDEQKQSLFAEFMQSDMVKNAVAAEVAAKDEEITRLSNTVGELQNNGYSSAVKAALNVYRVGEDVVPPVILNMAEEMLLSFGPEERNATITLSMGEGDAAKEETLSRVQLMTKILDETRGFIKLSNEQGSGKEPTADEVITDEDEAVNFLLNLSNSVVE